MNHSRKSPSKSARGTRKQQKLMRFPHELAERAAEASEQLGISGNELQVRALADFLQRLRGPAPERDDATIDVEAQFRIAEALCEAVRSILKTEIGQAVDALAPRITRDVTAVLTPLRLEMASALNSGLRTIQGQVENLIADSILSSAAATSQASAKSLEPSAVGAVVRSTEQLNPAEPRTSKPNPRAQKGAGPIDNQQSLAAFARSIQKRETEPRPSSAARSFRKIGG
jgi:hypothetical protein